ncbi:MAG TPA: hypothetical protein VD838_21390, partial [Anaeromyxobacteraceae bacterium]|nr:hypothetical protein [Anaeromyxobacteraceae bacterium]
MPKLAQTRESTEAELARLEQLRAMARKLMKIVVAVPGPATVAVYLLHAVARPVWQFQVLLATAVLMAAALAVAAVLVHRDRFEQAAAVAFAGVTLQCVAPLALRADTFEIAVLGQIGAIMLVWFLAPHRLLRTGI